MPEFDAICAKAGLNSFSLSPRQWIQRTSAIGLIVQTGQRAGTYAHPDIAFEFASWLSVEFKLYLTKEYQRLRLEADEEQALSWQLNRVFSKVSSRLHSRRSAPTWSPPRSRRSRPRRPTAPKPICSMSRSSA
jgi:hypothetical protein